MANEANKKVRGNPSKLQPVRTKQEASERGRNGGIASGKARRKKRALIQCAKTVLEADIPPKMRKTLEQLTGDIDGEDNTLFTAMCAVMAKSALEGDARAFHELATLAREIDEQSAETETVKDDPISAALKEIADGL